MSTYPRSLAEIDGWAKANQLSRGEAIKRFVQFATLASIAADAFGSELVLKGGHALRVGHASVRGTLDLDFTVTGAIDDNRESVQRSLQAAVTSGFPRYGLKGKVQSTKRNPPGSDKNYPTYEVRIGFQLPWDKHFKGFEERDKPVSTVVVVELSLNDVVCETELITLEEGTISIRTCSLEDIIAEKLRALLQQVVRNRYRAQDVYDIASITKSAELDLEKVARFFEAKCAAREIEPRKAAFDDEVRKRAAEYYPELAQDLGAHYIEFDAAWEEVLGLVARLPIAD